MSRSDVDYLSHILLETNYLLISIKDLDKDSFLQDETKKRAFVRSFEIIGEAVKNLSSETRNQYPDISWRKLAGMRDRLIHNYFGVDYEIVWDAIINEIPLISSKIKNIINDIAILDEL